MILSEEEVQDERDDGAPIEVLEQYFEARGWACERTAEGEIVASATPSVAGSPFVYVVKLSPVVARPTAKAGTITCPPRPVVRLTTSASAVSGSLPS